MNYCSCEALPVCSLPGPRKASAKRNLRALALMCAKHEFEFTFLSSTFPAPDRTYDLALKYVGCLLVRERACDRN